MSRTASATIIPASNVFVPNDLGKVTVLYDGREFSVLNSKGEASTIQRGDLSQDLRGVSNEILQKMLEVGQLNLKKVGDDYALNFEGKIRGGGLFGAICVYVGTNIVGGAMIVVGAATAPLGVGVGLIAAGTATITAAPATFLVTLPTPTP